jgi:hypothetical protein
MRILRMEAITRGIVRANPAVLFLFGDNDIRQGMGGQAKGVVDHASVMRGELNARGIRTKKLPAMTPEAFWTDKEYEQNEAKIDEDFWPVERHLAMGGAVVMPASGLGTGLGRMGRQCPKTFVYLCNRLETLLKTYGQTTQPDKIGLRGDWI